MSLPTAKPSAPSPAAGGAGEAALLRTGQAPRLPSAEPCPSRCRSRPVEKRAGRREGGGHPSLHPAQAAQAARCGRVQQQRRPAGSAEPTQRGGDARRERGRPGPGRGCAPWRTERAGDSADTEVPPSSAAGCWARPRWSSPPGKTPGGCCCGLRWEASLDRSLQAAELCTGGRDSGAAVPTAS